MLPKVSHNSKTWHHLSMFPMSTIPPECVILSEQCHSEEEDGHQLLHSSPHGSCQCLPWHPEPRCTFSLLNPADRGRNMAGSLSKSATWQRCIIKLKARTWPASSGRVGRKRWAAPSSQRHHPLLQLSLFYLWSTMQSQHSPAVYL